MEGFYTEKYSFVGEWHDPTANLTRTFYIFFFPYDNSLEMFDLKTRKTFVRRIKVDGITLSNFYMGASVNILGRIVKIVEYACEDTRKKLSKMVERTFALIKPIPTTIVGELINDICENGFTISKIKKTLVTAADVMEIYKDIQHESYFPFLVEYLSGKHVYGMELVGENAVEKFKEVAGDTDPQVAAVGTLRRKYGTDIAHNSLHVALSAKNATENIEYFFPPPAERTHRLGLTATLKNCTCCIIKPHALKDGKIGAIIKAIAEADFEISALNMYNVEVVNAGEFLEVYKGVLTEYKAMVDELASGPCIAMEIVSNKPGVNTPYEFRQLVGPSDPEIARYLRPNTLRAKFGKTKIQNAVHCSDLPEDGLLEVEYFFKILYL